MRYLFETYAFDTDRRELHRGADLVTITPQVFDLLDYLIRNRERVVSKDDLIDAIWGGRIVSEAALTTRLNAARSAIGDSGKEQRLIKTLPRKGIRFVGSVQEAQGSAGGAAHGHIARTPRPALALPDKPSIAVLPFTNMSGDPEQDYFADGMVEDIITALSRFNALFVIARNSSFTYKGRPVDVKRGRARTRRALRAGGQRSQGGKSGAHHRTTGRAIDRGAHLGRKDSMVRWKTCSLAGPDGRERGRGDRAEAGKSRDRAGQAQADRKSRRLCPVLTRIGQGLSLSQPPSQRRGLAVFLQRDRTRSGFASAYGHAASCYAFAKVDGWISGTPDEIAEVARLAQRAVELGSDDANALSASGWALAFMVRDLEAGATLIDRALVLNSNMAEAWLRGGWVKIFLGEPELAIERLARAMRLSPVDPRINRARSQAPCQALDRQFRLSEKDFYPAPRSHASADLK